MVKAVKKKVDIVSALMKWVIQKRIYNDWMIEWMGEGRKEKYRMIVL